MDGFHHWIQHFLKAHHAIQTGICFHPFRPNVKDSWGPVNLPLPDLPPLENLIEHYEGTEICSVRVANVANTTYKSPITSYYSNFAEHLTTQTGRNGANFCVTCEKETGIPVAFSQNHLRMPVFPVESFFSKTASVRLCEHSKIAAGPMSAVSIYFLNLYWKNMSLCNIAYSIPHLAQLF